GGLRQRRVPSASGGSACARRDRCEPFVGGGGRADGAASGEPGIFSGRRDSVRVASGGALHLDSGLPAGEGADRRDASRGGWRSRIPVGGGGGGGARRSGGSGQQSGRGKGRRAGGRRRTREG